MWMSILAKTFKEFFYQNFFPKTLQTKINETVMDIILVLNSAKKLWIAIFISL
jgi:hypothetical protein